jgi:hypothetical protein
MSSEIVLTLILSRLLGLSGAAPCIGIVLCPIANLPKLLIFSTSKYILSTKEYLRVTKQKAASKATALFFFVERVENNNSIDNER